MPTRSLVTMMVALVVAPLVAGANAADERYDRKLAQAAAEIVAGRMGPLRGGFSVGERPAFHRSQPPPAMRGRASGIAPPAPGEWRDGLAIAVEKRSAVSPEL